MTGFQWNPAGIRGALIRPPQIQEKSCESIAELIEGIRFSPNA